MLILSVCNIIQRVKIGARLLHPAVYAGVPVEYFADVIIPRRFEYNYTVAVYDL